MNKFNYYKRGFLNIGEGMAAFEASLSAEADETWSHLSADFSLTDCNRKVSLDFSAYNKEGFKDRLAKLDLLIAELSEFRGKMVDAELSIQLKNKNEEVV